MQYADIILKIFLPIIMGYLLQKTGYFSAAAGSTLRMFVIRITVPLLIFTSMYTTRRDTLVS
jgi:predicted permease